jgi:sulfate transport system ATP-binding protein
MSIEIRNVAKRFGDFIALDNVDLDVPTGELVALLGPSGCGKTTLLRIIAGLETADAGTVRFHGADTTGLTARDRHVGFVFQHYALFRHMTVFENVAFGLRVKPRRERPSDAVIKDKVHKLLNLVQLDWLGDRHPAQLSGGQRQRIALARALAVEPKVLLLDEPFGALDAKVRKELRRWLRRLHDELHVTSVFVTHDQEEALEVADRVVLMQRGRIEQIGSPQSVYETPANAFVYGFLGHANRFEGRWHDGAFRIDGAGLEDIRIATEQGAAGPRSDGSIGVAFARPHELDVLRDAPGLAGIRAQLTRALVVGSVARLELQRGSGTIADSLEVELPREEFERLAPRDGEHLTLRPRQLRVFAPEPGR